MAAGVDVGVSVAVFVAVGVIVGVVVDVDVNVGVLVGVASARCHPGCSFPTVGAGCGSGLVAFLPEDGCPSFDAALKSV